MSTIIEVNAREILDARGNPTIEVEVLTESGYYVRPRFVRRFDRANTKPSNYAMATKGAIWVKAL
jgi:hypothetical protein